MESKFQRNALKLLSLIPESYWFKVVVANDKGTLDVAGGISGRAFFIELKDDQNEPDAMQQFRIQQAQDAKCVAFFANSIGMLCEGLERNGIPTSMYWPRVRKRVRSI